MPYLISDISDDTELLPVNAALSNPSYPLFYDLASETVKVLAGANTTEWQVARGVGNTQAVRHSRGTPLVLNTNPYSGGGGGVTVTGSQGGSVATATGIELAGAVSEASPGQALQSAVTHYLGPFVIEPDTLDRITGISLFGLQAGDLVIGGGAIVSETWNGDIPVLDVFSSGTPNNVLLIANAALDIGVDPNDMLWVRYAFKMNDLGSDKIGLAEAQAPTTITATVTNGATPPTTGVVRIFAIVVTPAS